MKKSRISLFKKIAVCLLMTFLIPISGLTTSPALATAPSPTVIPCGGSAGTPHFSEGVTAKETGKFTLKPTTGATLCLTS